MLAAVDWNSLSVASAFVLGGIFGMVAAIRIMRSILRNFNPYLFRRHDDPDDSGNQGS